MMKKTETVMTILEEGGREKVQKLSKKNNAQYKKFWSYMTVLWSFGGSLVLLAWYSVATGPDPLPIDDPAVLWGFLAVFGSIGMIAATNWGINKYLK